MRIAVLGTGVVGATLGSKLVDAGHEVRMGSRTADSPKAAAWLAAAGAGASQGTFADAAAFGEAVFNCTAGVVSLEALAAAGRENLAGKVLVDVSNPLDFSRGMPPTLTVCNDDSLGEQIQRQFPDVRVVKALNTVTASLMVDPAALPGDHDLFVCGNDPEAKARVSGWLVDWLGWRRESLVDLGDISNARGTEMWLMLWIRLMGVVGGPMFNIHVVRGA